MDDQSALLNQLRIDRGQAPEPGGGGWLRWLLIAAAVLAVIGAAAYLLGRPSAVPVPVVSAMALGSNAAASGSVLDASGYVVARRQATVSAKITGKVVAVLIEEGQKVEAGEVVARLEDTNIRAAFNQSEAQLAAARAQAAEISVNLANAERDLARKKGLVQDRLISVAELDTSQTALDALRASASTAQRNVEVAARGLDVAQRNLDDTTVRAPFSGVITVKAAQVGEIVSPLSAGGGFTRTGIGTVVDMDSLEVEVDVNENFINRVGSGRPARVRLNAYPDWDIPATVIAVIPTADRSKATVKVRVGFNQRDERILPEMGARVSFLSEPADLEAPQARTSGVVLPAEAIVADGETGTVFVVNGNRVERRAVKLGPTVASGRVVLSGINAGERVAAGNLAKLADGAKITVQPAP